MTEQVESILTGKLIVVLAWLALFFVGERVWPAALPPPALSAPGGGPRRLGRNLVLWAINSVLSPLIVVPLTAWAAAFEGPIDLRSSGLGGWPGLLLDLLVLDGLIYWWHRFNHEWPMLWRFHRVHHLDRFLDSTSALRFHFGEVLLSAAARAGVIILLDVPLTSVVAFEATLLCATIFHHSNLRLPPRLERGLARVVVTPSIHWVHHHAARFDTDSNYSTLFSFWDRLFGSASPTQRRPDMPIGVEGEAEPPLPELVLLPFRRGKRR